MKTDVVIIGGGIVGCAAAYYLAKQGVKATVVERNPGLGREASGVNGGGVRQHGRKALLPMAMASVRMWANLAEELGSDLEYRRTGNINVAIDEDAVNSFEQEIAREHAHGLQDVRLLTARECHEIVPGMTGQVIAGKICTTDGLANPMLAAPAFAKAARRLGAQFILNTPVTALLQQGTQVCGVQTDQGEIFAETVLNTAGPWASQFSAQAGCTMPIYPGLSQLMVTTRLPKDWIKLWVSVRGQGYMRPTVSGNVILGTSGARNDNYGRQINFDRAALQADRWGTLFPWFKDVPIIRLCGGITEYTPDACPYIGAVPGVSGLFVAAAFHGEGFCTGPMVGKTLADLVTGKEPEVSLEPFKPGRFDQSIREGKPIPQVVFPFDKMFKHPVMDPGEVLAPFHAA